MSSIDTQIPQAENFKDYLYANSKAIGFALTIMLAIFVSFAPISLISGLLLTIALTVGGICLIRYPIVGVLLVLLTAPFAAYEARAGVPIIGFLPLATGQISFIGLALLWLFTRFTKQNSDLPRAHSFTWLLVFAGVAILTILSADSTADGAKEVVKWIQFGFMMLIAVDLVRIESKPWARPEHSIWILIGFLAVGALTQSFIGIFQFINPDGPESFQILGRFFRAFGTFEQPNPYGGYIAWHLVFFAGLVVTILGDQLLAFIGYKHPSPTSPMQPHYLWLLLSCLLILLSIIVIALIASWSRGAWLAAATGLGAIAFFAPKDRRIGILLLVLAIGSVVGAWQAGLLPASITDRLASSIEIEFVAVRDQEVSPENFAVLERQAFWQAAFSMFESNIWTGIGFGNYDAAYADHYVGTWERSLGHAHNYYINLLAEVGLIGLFAYCVFWVAIIGRLIKLLPRLHSLERGVALGVLGVWVSLSVHHLVDKLYVNNNWLTLAVFLALQEILINRTIQKELKDSIFDLSSR